MTPRKLNPSAFLVVSTTAGFFALLCLLFFRAYPESSKEILLIMTGTVAAKWGDVVAYFFGSSHGSARKTDMLKTQIEETEKETP